MGKPLGDAAAWSGPQQIASDGDFAAGRAGCGGPPHDRLPKGPHPALPRRRGPAPAAEYADRPALLAAMVVPCTSAIKLCTRSAALSACNRWRPRGCAARRGRRRPVGDKVAKRISGP